MTTGKSKARAKAKPLTMQRLDELALSYVGRFATTRAKLEAYLARKLRERGWEGEDQPQPAAIAARFVELGYVDDAGWARSRSEALLHRGYGPRRVNQSLVAAGIEEEVRETVNPGEGEARRAALAFARRRRLGPFGNGRPERDQRERQLAAMVRAGHGFEAARAVVDAASPRAAEAWAAEAQES